MDSSKRQNETRETLVAEIESLQSDLADLRSDVQRYRSLVEATSDWVWSVDRNARYTYASPRVRDLLGREPQEVLGRTPFDFMPPEESRRIRQLFETLAELRQPIKQLENINVRKDGRQVILETSGEQVFDADGNLVGYQGIDRDITERKRAEEALREGEQHFRSLIESAPEAIFVQSQGRFVYLNPPMLKLFGADNPQDLVGADAWERVAPEFHEAVRERIRFQRETGKPAPPKEEEYLRLDGSRVPVEATAVAIRYQGRDAHLVFVRDITERKRAAESLRASEERFRWLFEKAPVAAGISRNGRILLVNQRYVGLYGFQSANELVGQPVVDLWAPASREMAREYARRRASGEPVPWEYEATAQRKDGSQFPVQAVVTPVDLPDGPAFMGFFTDITGRKREETALRASEERFQRLFDGAADAVFVHDRQGRIVDVNQVACQSLGYTREQLLRMSVPNVEVALQPTDLALLWERIRTGQSATVESLHRRRDGSIFPVEVHIASLVPGERDLFFAAARDITRRKRAEQALADERRFIEALFTSLPGNVFAFDRNGRRVRWNDYCIKVLGWSEDDLRDLGICDMVALRDRQRCELAFREALLNGHAEVELVGLAKDGREVPFFFNTVRAELAGEPYAVAVGIDISDRKQAEQQLQEFNATLEKRVAERTAELRHREREYRTLFEGIPVGVYRTTFDGHILQANPAFFEILGYAGLNLREQNTIDRYVNLDDRRRWVQRLEAEETVRDFEVQMRRTDGSVIWVSNTASLVRDDGGQVLYIEGSLTDITERKRAEEEVLKEKALSDAVINGLPGAFYMFDRQGQIVRWNEEYVKVTGASVEDVANNRILGRIADDDKERVAAAVERVLAQGQASIEAEVVTKGGKPTPFHLAARRLQLGEQIYLVGVGYDISERKRAEEALRESEAKYRALAENINDIVYSLDTEGRLTYVSPQAAQYGFVAEELVGHQFLDFAAPEDRQRLGMEFGKAMKTGIARPSEFRIQGKAGQAYWLEDHAKVLRDETGRIQGMAGVLRDVTARKEAQAAAELHASRVRQLAVKLSLAEEQERRRLAATLHDDLVQVLVGTQMRFAVLHRAVDESARQQGMDQVESLVSRSVQVARSLMSQLSHRALYEMGFVPAARWLSEDMHGLFGLKVTIEDDGQPKPMTEPVRVLLYQCLREALTNAAKHAGVEEAHVSLHRDGSVVRVLVEDKGVGFDPSAVSPRPDGGGFGLFSIEERLEPLGGRVDIQSAPGQGTRVVLEVPVEGDGP